MYALSFFLSPKSAIPFTFSPFGPIYQLRLTNGFSPGHSGFSIHSLWMLQLDVSLSLSKVGLGRVSLFDTDPCISLGSSLSLASAARLHAPEVDTQSFSDWMTKLATHLSFLRSCSAFKVLLFVFSSPSNLSPRVYLQSSSSSFYFSLTSTLNYICL